MRYYMDWRDYVNLPHIKQLIESKGIAAAKSQYLKESNSALWYDPFIITETVSPGTTVSNNSSAAGGSTQFIVGEEYQVDTFTWAAGIRNGITGSAAATGSGDGLQGFYFDVSAYNGTTDFSANHVNSTKTFRFYVVSSSGFVATNTNGIAGVITASYTDIIETSSITGSIITLWHDAVNNQLEDAVVAGFTNTIAPSSILNSEIAEDGSYIILTGKFRGGVPQIQTNFTAATASVTTITQGTDKIWNPTNYYNGASTFNGSVAPYTMMPRRNV